MIALIKRLFHRFRRLISYGIVGCINTVADYIVFYFFYRLIGLPIQLSQAAGFLSGTCVSYLLNSNVTFKEGKGRAKAQFFQYIGVDVFFSVLTSLFMGWAEKNLPVPVLALKVFVTVVVALLHYTIYKYVIFRIKKEDDKR